MVLRWNISPVSHFVYPKTSGLADFLKKAICKKLQQAVKFHRHPLYLYLSLSLSLALSHNPWITKQTRSASFHKTFPFSSQENFLEISNTQTGKFTREVSSKFVYHTETNCHYKLLEPLFVAESWPICPDNTASYFKLQARFCSTFFFFPKPH